MEDEVLRRMAETGEQIGKDWVQSPFKHLLENRLRTMRRRPTGPEALIDFPLLAEFRDRGLTDWVAYAHGFGIVADLDWTDEVGMVSSWATDAPEGFADDDLDSLHELASTFALAGLISPREIFTLG